VHFSTHATLHAVKVKFGRPALGATYSELFLHSKYSNDHDLRGSIIKYWQFEALTLAQQLADERV
jgi:hypothetical protein